MPTYLSNCSECNLNYIVEEFHTTNENCRFLFNLYKENEEKLKCLIEATSLPKEICIKIIKQSSLFGKCSYCETKLCKDHVLEAKKWAKYYRNVDNKFMCSKCCWIEVS